MSLFAIGDLHLSFGVDKPMDVFMGWNDYVNRLEKNWKKLVKNDDTVVIMGDISWGINYDEAIPDLKWINELPGKKILIKGNHDLWWDTTSKNNRVKEAEKLDNIEFLFNCCYEAEGVAVCGTRSWFYDAEADENKKILNREIGRLKASLNDAVSKGLRPIVFLHYPPLNVNEKCDEIIEVLKEYGIKECYYAHTHGYAIATAFNGEHEGIKFRLLSADYLQFCPYLLINN